MTTYRIEGETLVAHRAASVMSSLRTFGFSSPLLAATLIHWREELVLLVVVCGVTALASGYSSWRALHELKQPASEHFTLEGGVLTHFVGGQEKARLDQRQVRTMMQNRSALSVAGGGVQIIVPSHTTGYQELVTQVGGWGTVMTPADMGDSTLKQMGVRGVFFALLALAAIGYFVAATGSWKTMLYLLPVGIVPAEALARWAVKSARSRALTTF